MHTEYSREEGKIGALGLAGHLAPTVHSSLGHILMSW